jgi:hypothetical protein
MDGGVSDCVYHYWYVAYTFVFLGSIIICRLYKFTLSEQAQVTLQLTVSGCDLV